MPFNAPFRHKFYKSDLIYGLMDEIHRYIYKVIYFRDAITHFEHNDYPPALVSDYLIPLEVENFNDFMAESRGSEDPNDIRDQREVNTKLKYIDNADYRKYKESLFGYWKRDTKYSSVTTRTDYNTQIMGRKCKGAMSWININNDPLIKGIHLHFILDGINMEEVISKYYFDINEHEAQNQYYSNEDNMNENNGFVSIDLNQKRVRSEKSIVGKELRWIFRNRGNTNVAKKIQFWKNGCPTNPPWVGNECLIWDKYALHLEAKGKKMKRDMMAYPGYLIYINNYEN
ncbi:hypothetical protein Xmau_02487 [Xenorhabdus mauleonii]|uniref:Uncharacterized protein n=1 Tax=Xenorhabdus mauleonii TaxID=351675 RepID=A0A1I3RGG1_9GAMM|nr:hypothetical protein [Xenorhabdus mauleonii]PHM39885.1 hypothetical protein Xmau_02487 [Xenorhabdus mauleonii]SFJ45355.1 hypothetical protein SAMN05421680_109122 [Xenorhabdus mauleonii]